jgi:hypothetical protein
LLFQRVNRTDAEKVFVIVQNVSAATVTAGYPVVWDITSSVDGVRVSKPATATLSLFVGLANADIADSSYGLVQVYGYKSQALITNDTSVAVAAGDILIPVNAQWYLARTGASDGKSGFVYAGAAVATGTTPAAANAKVLIRAL